jgi:quercetin dioxygenase-like cupin family protein
MNNPILRAKERPGLFRVILVLALIASVALIGRATATPPSGTITAETFRGAMGNTKINKTFANGATLKLETTGAMEIIQQRVVVEPGASLGWHTHPAPNVVLVAQGTLTLYHDDHCTEGIGLVAGSAFKTLPRHVHLARNDGVGPVIFFATYFGPRTIPETAVRVDELSPGDTCTQ